MLSSSFLKYCCLITGALCRESAHPHVDNDLPFELKALEAALTHALLLMEEDAVNLHKQISPMLGKLSFKVAHRAYCLDPC